jgi:predicted O-linked N-acetylglucosamine transferase (SPINDLY family)
MRIAVVDSGWEYTLDTPYNEPLGGTQSAICYFLEEMKSLNHEVYLFNKVKEQCTIREVKHIPAVTYLNYIKNNNLNLDILIISCLVNDLLEIKINLNNPNILYCLWTGHDIDQPVAKLLNDVKMKDFVDLFIFVSDWQRNRYVNTYKINYNKTLILKNGIGKPFEKYLDLPIDKRSNSMTYCSIPWRGLDLLIPIYKELKNKYKDSTLNIYSGMNIYKKEETENNSYDELKTMESVKYNYGISQTLLAQELYNIDYLTYPNIFPETSCISILQAMACGCLIITSNLGALKETMDGMNDYVDINIFNFDKNQYIKDFINKVSNNIELNKTIKNLLREKNRDYIRKNYLWSIICKKFETDIIAAKNNYINYIKTHTELLNTCIQNFATQKWVDCLNISNNLMYYLNLNEYSVIKLNNGVSYYQIQQFDSAKESFKIAKNIKNDFNVNKNIALLELQRNKLDKFIKYARIALSISFEIDLANLLAEKYELLGLYNDAIGIYESIIYLDPNNINAYNNYGNLNLLKISQVDDIDKVIDNTYGKSLKLCVNLNEHRKKELVLSNILFNNLYNWKLTDEEILHRTCKWYDYFPKQQNLIDIADKLNRMQIINNSKIKIGFISCDFITHPVGFMFNSILKNININNFDIYCYDCCDIGRSAGDETAKILRSYNNASWIDFSNINDNDALTIIINHNLDILVDMMGHTRNTRMNLLQYKPARILISYFAYPGTTGLKEIDYKISDKYATPPETQKFYVEKLYYLPNGFQCYTPPAIIESKKNYNRDKYKIHLCCFNNPIKLSIPTIDTFCEILNQLPEAKLYLRYCYYKSSYYRATIIKLFTDRGILKERIDIEYQPILEALKLYDIIDVCLDPFPYNGGTISSEALYMNTPFITLAGTSYVSRVGVSLLYNLGLQKYIANTTEEYIQKVVDLARNTNELKILHQILRIKMMNTDLCNSVTFTKNIEAAFIDMANIYNKKIGN